MVSKDDGETWSWPRILVDSAVDDRDAGILETSKGTLLVTTFGSIAYDSPRNREKYAQQADKWARFDRGETLKAVAPAAGPRLLRSEDGGLTWSAPQAMPVNSPHGPIQLMDGRLLYAGIGGLGKGPYAEPGERKLGAWESHDDGLTWKLLSLIPARRGEKTSDYHELHAVEAANGTLVVLLRSHADDARRQMLQTESSDGGISWTEPRVLGLFGYPPHLLRLRDGRLLLSYDHRRAPYGVQARVSSDHGATWSHPIVITSHDKKLDQGYPSTVELEDGTLLSVWYEVPAGAQKAVLKRSKWRLEYSSSNDH